MKKNKKKISKYLVGSIAVAAISATVVSAAVGCSSVNSKTSPTSSSNNSKAITTTLAVKGATKSEGTDYYAPFNDQVTLNVNSTNLPSSNITYSWYCNNTLISKQTSSNSLSIQVTQTKNTYYVITFVNGVKKTTSNQVIITPTFDANEFNGIIDANTGPNNTMQQVSQINNVTNVTSYKLVYHVWYGGQEFSVNPTSVSWTINNQVQSNNTSSSIIINNLKMGTNTISATCTITINGKNYPISKTSLIINNPQLVITGNKVQNNQVNVAYNGSLTLTASSNSLAFLTNATISHPTYQWYEISNGQKQGIAINGQTSTTLTLNNLIDNATYYLVASWQEDNTTYTLTSNHIMVQVNGVSKLTNPRIVCNLNNTKITNSLNLGTSNINNTYQFSINDSNSDSVGGTVTYTLKDLTTNQVINLANNTSSLSDSYSINFNELGLIKGNQYQLSASISTPSANNETITYNSTTYPDLSFTIYYDNVTIAPNTSSSISQVGNSNTYDANENSSITFSTTTFKGTATGTISYQWQTSSNGQTWSNVDSATTSQLTIISVGTNNIYYQLIETIGNLILTSNPIEIVPVSTNAITATIYSNNSNSSSPNTINIYHSSNAKQTLYLAIKNGVNTLDLSNVQNLQITWMVNNKAVANSNTPFFTNTYAIGQNEVTVQISFEWNSTTYSSTGASQSIKVNTFDVNYYNLAISAKTSTLASESNANTNDILFDNSTTYYYQNALYQWLVNGQLVGQPTNNIPISLPNYVIASNSTFQLEITNANNPNLPPILSNIISITATTSSSYSNIVISTTTTPYYGYNVTLTSNISDAQSYAWYLVTNNKVGATPISTKPTYMIEGITTDQSYQLVVISPNGQTYSSSIYQVKVNKLSNLTLSTTYNLKGYATWWVNEQLATFIGQSGFNSFINQNGIGYAIASNVTYQDFKDYKCYFQAMPKSDGFGNQQFLTISAIATSNISMATWNGGWTTDASLQVPSGSLFTWTLPYELSSLYYSDGNIGLNMLNPSDWLTASYAPSLNIPFGLSIGNATNPTAISNNGNYKQATNGVIGIAYGNSIEDTWNAPTSWYNAYPGAVGEVSNGTPIANINPNNNATSIVLTDEDNSVNIGSNSLITFLTSASTIAGKVSPTSFTNDTTAITPTSCTYQIIKDGKSLLSGNAAWINDEAMVNYNFNQPGQYEIEITYTIPNLGNTTLQQTATYKVNYNQVAISVPTTNPTIGSTVTLSVNNSMMYAPSTNATYEWQQLVNGAWKTVEKSSATTYNATIDVYNETYEYQLIETINGIVYTGAPVSLTPNLANFTASAAISSANAINGQIGITKNTSQTFNLSVTCNKVTYDATNNSALSNVNIIWSVNNTTFGSSSWTANYAPTNDDYGSYEISASITFTLYGKTFSKVTSNIITLAYSNQIGTLTIIPPTSTSPYVYNSNQSKLVIWGNGKSTQNDTPITFDVSGITYNAKNKYSVAFYNGSTLGTTIPITYDIRTNSFSIAEYQFIDYSSLKLLVNGVTASQVIAYSYLPQKPWFEIAPHTTINVADPQIVLQPNESLGNATLGALTPADLSFNLNVNGTSMQISYDRNSPGVQGNATIIIDNQTSNPITLENFYDVSVSGQTYVIRFNKDQFVQLIKAADYSGIWTTIQLSVSLNGVTLDGQAITGPNPLTEVIGYANSNNSNNQTYVAGIYWNNIPVTSVPVGATNVTLQVSGTNSADQIQWIEVTSNQTIELTNATTTTFNLPATAFATPNATLTYEAQITTASGTVITNQCKVRVNNLGQATINVYDPNTKQTISESNYGYTLTSGDVYDIQTTGQSGVAFNNQSNDGTSLPVYYQWQYKSNVVILGGTASNSAWTNLSNATSSYQPYSYTAVPMYSVSFRLVVFTDSSTPTSFNPQTDTQYIVSNTVNTYAAFNCTYSLSTTTSSIKQGTTVTYTLNPSNQQALMQLIESCQYQYETYNSTTGSYNEPTWFYPVTVTWYYKLSSGSSYTTAATLPVVVANGKLEFEGYDSLSYQFAANDFSSGGTYDIYAKINYTDNYNESSTSTYHLTVVGKPSSLNYNYEQYVTDYIQNWLNSNEGVANASLNGTQSQSTFNDLIQQNGAGYEVHATYQDFADYHVSFTDTPSADASELGSSNEWLTITATSITTIDMYYWEGNSGWGASGGTTVASGKQFSWTLPYSLASITYNSASNGGMLEMPVNSIYSNQANNESLPVPFGLSVGTASSPTAVSSTWSYTSNYGGVLANNYGSNGESFTLPSSWVVPYNQDDAFVNFVASGLANNTTNFGGTTFTAQTLITNMISQNMAGFKFPDATFSDFSNWYVSWDSTKIKGYTVLQLNAYSNINISVQVWDNGASTNGAWQTISNYSIPSGSYFTWTLPYNQASMSFDRSTATLSNAGIPYATYFDASKGSPLWTTPLGVSVGSFSSPTSITSSTIFTTTYNNSIYGTETTYNGVIGIGYNNSTPSLTFNIPPQTTSNTNSSYILPSQLFLDC